MRRGMDPTPITGTSVTRERSRVLHVDLHFIIDGPENEGDEEPWDQILGFRPATTPVNLPEIARLANKQDDGDWLLVIHYEGLPAGDRGLVLLEIDHAGSEDPIESFPKYNALAKKWKAYPLNQGRFQGWQPTIKDPSSGETVQNPMLGTTHYLNDTAILRVSFLTADFDPRILWNICKIDTSLVPDKAKPYLVKQENQQWLKRSVKGGFRGNVWQFDIEWMLGTWSPDIYSPTVTGQPLPDVASANIINSGSSVA